LSSTQRLVDGYVRDPLEHPWQEVIDTLTNPPHHLIALLINNRVLFRTFWNRNVNLTIFTLHQVVELDNPDNFESRQPVDEDIRQQIQSLNQALTDIDREMPQEGGGGGGGGEEEENRDRRGWRTRLRRFFGSSPS